MTTDSIDSDDKTLSSQDEKSSTDTSFSFNEDAKSFTNKIHSDIVKHEIPRKVFHSSIGVLTLYLYTQGVTVPQLFTPLFTCFTLVLINDLIRLHNPGINKIICKYMWFIIRDKEVNSYNGVLYYLAGVLIVLYLYPKDISVLSILLLSWADTAASTFGRLYGKYTFKVGKGKSFAGCVASCLIGVLTSYMFYGYFIHLDVNQPGEIYWSSETSVLNLHLYSLIVGLVASFSEFIDLFSLDDNFTIPVLSGTLLNFIVGWAHK